MSFGRSVRRRRSSATVQRRKKRENVKLLLWMHKNKHERRARHDIALYRGCLVSLTLPYFWHSGEFLLIIIISNDVLWTCTTWKLTCQHFKKCWMLLTCYIFSALVILWGELKDGLHSQLVKVSTVEVWLQLRLDDSRLGALRMVIRSELHTCGAADEKQCSVVFVFWWRNQKLVKWWRLKWR